MSEQNHRTIGRPDGPANRPYTRDELREIEAARELARIKAKRAERPEPQAREEKKTDGLGHYLKQIQSHLSRQPGQTAELDPTDCELCRDKGYVSPRVPVGHPFFGEAIDCPDCGGGPRRIEARRAGLKKKFGEVWLYDSLKLNQHDLTDFVELDPRRREGKARAIDAAYDWSRAIGLPNLILSGEPGLGKTCLAAAAFLARVSDSALGLPIEYNALMSRFLSMVTRDDDGKRQDPYTLITSAARVPILLLDDLGNEDRYEAETQGRARWLFEIINQRYNYERPTLITTNLSEDHLYEQFGAKLTDRILERAVWRDLSGASLRFG